MTDRAWFMLALFGVLALAMLGFMWWRLYQRARRAPQTEVGSATRHELQKHKLK